MTSVARKGSTERHAGQAPHFGQNLLVRRFGERQRGIHALRDAEGDIHDVIHRNREVLGRDEQRQRERDADDRGGGAARKPRDTPGDHACLAVEVPRSRISTPLPSRPKLAGAGGARAAAGGSRVAREDSLGRAQHRRDECDDDGPQINGQLGVELQPGMRYTFA